MVVKRSGHFVPEVRDRAPQAVDARPARYPKPQSTRMEPGAAPLRTCAETHPVIDADVQGGWSIAQPHTERVLESRALEEALLAGRPLVPSTGSGGNSSSSGGFFSASYSAPPVAAPGFEAPPAPFHAHTEPVVRHVPGVLSVTELERSFQGVTTSATMARTPTAPPTQATAETPGTGALKTPWNSSLSAGLRSGTASTTPHMAGSVPRAEQHARSRDPSTYESAFPCWSATETGIHVAPAEVQHPRESSSHLQAMKPHEIEKVRYLQQRSLHLTESEDAVRAEAFYATELAARRHAAASQQHNVHERSKVLWKANQAQAERTPSMAGMPPSHSTSTSITGNAGGVRGPRRHPPNAAALASALGAPPKWTPQAPRQVLSLELDPDSATWQATEQANGEANPSGSFHEDPRIKARGRIEQAYDVLHGMALETGSILVTPALFASLSAAQQTAYQETLCKLLGLYEHGSSATGAVASSGPPTAQLFYSICAIPKGKRLLTQVWQLLRATDRQRVYQLFLGRLAAYCSTELENPANQHVTEAFWGIITDGILQYTSLHELAVLLDAFRTGHARSRVLTQVALSSEKGTHLLRMLFTQAFKLLQQQQQQQQQQQAASTTESAAWTRAVNAFVDWITRYLGDAFDLASPRAAAELWELIALIDALIEPGLQAQFRSTLRSLIEQGRAPQPPAPDVDGGRRTASSTQ
jgi:hypothetical protein